MGTFVLDSTKDDHYVGCTSQNRAVVPTSFPNSIVVYRLKKKDEIMVFDNDWDTVTIINPTRTTATGFNSLVVNGSTVSVRDLSQDICRHRLRVNWLGYCFQEVPQNSGRTNNPTDPVNQYKRMNDMLYWKPYGAMVNPQTAVKPSIRWNRVDIINGTPILYSLSDKEVLTECEKALEKSKGKVKELEAKKKKEFQENKDLEVILLEANKELETRNKRLERDNRDSNKENDQLIRDKNRVIKELQKRKEGLKTRNRELQDEIFDLEARKKQLQSNKRDLNQKNDHLERENNRLKQEVITLKQNCTPRQTCIPQPPPVPTIFLYQ